ncbi:hypothetical protein F4678DRAFT_451272 [Xylaria arbuscula]|nr:hypothetical protein F4678DRAFT_451272 [Xylaria arbuscula]
MEPRLPTLSNPIFHQNSNHSNGDQVIGVNYANGFTEDHCLYSNSYHQQLERNRHDGLGDQNIGVTHTQKGFQQLLHFEQTSPLAIVAMVTIGLGIIALSLGLGLGLGLRQDHHESESISTTIPPGASNMATSSTAMRTTMVSTSASAITSTTPTPVPTIALCKYGCYQDFQQMSGCHERCPGAWCLDDTGCEDPYPCVSNTCCYTGCLPGWSCNGGCSGSLTCVSAPSTVTTATSTCEGTR